MENTAPHPQNAFATEPIGRLIVKFAVPSVIALLVNSLYNIVDQIFIGNGVGYLGNGATNIVFPITIIALALAMMIGNGGAAFLSLKLGEGHVGRAKKGIGNAIGLVTVVSIALAAVFLLFIDPILTLFGATDTLRPYALEYGIVIGAGLPFMMISGAINSMIRADGSPKYAMFSMIIGAVLNVILDAVFIFPLQMGVRGAAIATGTQPIIGFNYGAKNFSRVKKALEISLIASEIISVLAFLLFQFAPMSVISLFGSEDGLYNEFAVKAFRIFLMLCPLTGFQTVIAVYLQAVGKPAMSALLSLARQILFFVPAALLLPLALGVEGVLWTGPVADGLAFLMSLALLVYERRHLKKSHAAHVAAQTP